MKNYIDKTINNKEMNINNTAVEQTQTPNYSFLISAKELDLLSPMEWLIDGVLPKPALTMLVGKPNVGKTFLMLDMACCVATGQDWQGRPTKQGKVVIIEAEGKRNLSARRDAWLNANKQDKDLFDRNAYFVFKSCQFLKEDDVNKLINDLTEMPEPPALLVIDTLARCNVGGDENSVKDMGMFMEACSRISHQFETTVLILHHSQKNDSTYRGSTAIEGALDSMLEMVKHQSGFKLHCGKQKDDSPFPDMFFRLEDEPISGSASVVASNAPSPVIKTFKIDEHCQKILDTIKVNGPKRYKELSLLSTISGNTFDRRVRLLLENKILGKSGIFYDLYENTVADEGELPLHRAN